MTALRLGDTAPDFTAQTTEGEITFSEWKGDGWAVLFSHPADFTPVCTTELGRVAQLGPEFAKRNTKVAAVSVDSVQDHDALEGRHRGDERRGRSATRSSATRTVPSPSSTG